MAAMTFPFLCFLLAFMQNADASLVLDINPSEISPGLTQSLTVNCTFSLDGVTDVVDIITLIIAKENQEEQFVDLVSLSVFSPDQITETTQLNGTSTVSGHIEGDGQSYLAIHWSFPTASQGGLYRCEVNGVDGTGHPTQKSQTMMVTSQSAGLDQLITKVSDLQRQLDRQESLNQNQSQTIDTLVSLTQTQSNMISEQETLNKNQSQTIDTLVSLTQTQSNMISALSNTVSNYKNTITSLEKKLQSQNLILAKQDFIISTEYNGHYYLLSNKEWKDSKVSEQTCEDYGSYLAEINDSDENEFVKGFLKSLSGFYEVLISGTEEGHEGSWTYTHSGSPLTFTDWWGNEPNSENYFCIVMYRGHRWQWEDYPCVHNYDNIRFVCEVHIN